MDYSAVTEVVGDAGVLVPYRELVDNEYDHFWAAVDEDAFARSVIRLAQKPALRREMGARGPRHITKFSWDTAAAQFAALVSPQSVEVAAA
jgi:glycosyltransferase involved in cell wall biosynthesis